jgi:hypothetical protein
MYDLIYANGDSYTAGSGLAQEMYYDSKPLRGYDVTSEVRTKVHISKMKCKAKWSIAERERSYPATLGAITNTEVINHAQGGAGLGQIAFTTVTDLIELSKQHNKILAIIGLTNPQRLFYPRPHNNTLLFNNHVANYNKIEQCVLEAFAQKFSNEELEINGIISLLAILQLCDWMNNVDIILIETPAYPLKHVDLENKYQILKDNIKPKVFDTLVPNYDKEMKIHTGCNHIIKKYHDDLAQRIYSKLWKN